MTDLSIAWTGGSSYVVYSPSDDGESNAYRVELTPDDVPTCNCEHGEHNQSDTAACKHIREAVKAHKTHPDLEHSTLQQWAGIIRDSSATLRDAEAALEGAQEANVAARETEAAAVQDAPDAAVAEHEPDGQQAAEAAETLQEAFDEHLTDMQVQHHVGYVWFQTGKDTEEEWPYPGVDETFEAVTSPDCVEYVSEGGDGYDAHELYDDKPGEWWKNALEPGDVEKYISEVLE